MLGIILMFVAGLVIAVSGGYIYQKKQDSEKFINSPLNRVTMVGASYLMAFGGILLIVALFLFLQQ